MAAETKLNLVINALGKGIDKTTAELLNLGNKGLKSVTDNAALAEQKFKEATDELKKYVAENDKAAQDYIAAKARETAAAEIAATAKIKAEQAAAVAVAAARQKEAADAAVVAAVKKRTDLEAIAAPTAALKKAKAEETAAVKAATAAQADAARKLAAADIALLRATTAETQAQQAAQTTIVAAAKKEQTTASVVAARQQAEAAKAGLSDIEKNHRNVTNNISSFWRATVSAIAISAAAAVASIVNVAKQFATFEHALNGVAKTADLSGAALKDFGEQARTLAKELGTPAAKILDLAQASAQLGVRGSKNILEFTKTIIKLEEASNLSAEEGASSIARILTLLEGGTTRIKEVASEIVKLGADFNATEQEIVANANRVSQAIAAFKPPTQDVIALSTALASAGVQAERSGGVMGRVFLALQKAIVGGGDELKNLEILTGLTGEQLKLQFDTNATEVFRLFINGMSKVTDEAFPPLLKQFDTLDSEGFATISALTANVKDLNKAFVTGREEIKKSGEALDKEYKARVDELQKKWDLFKVAVSDAAIRIGAEMAPQLKIIIGQATNFVNTLSRQQLESIGQGFISIASAMAKVIEKIPDITNFVQNGIAGWEAAMLRISNYYKDIQISGVSRDISFNVEEQKKLNSLQDDSFENQLKKQLELPKLQKEQLELENRLNDLTKERTENAKELNKVYEDYNKRTGDEEKAAAKDLGRGQFGPTPATAQDQYGPVMQQPGRASLPVKEGPLAVGMGPIQYDALPPVDGNASPKVKAGFELDAAMTPSVSEDQFNNETQTPTNIEQLPVGTDGGLASETTKPLSKDLFQGLQTEKEKQNQEEREKQQKKVVDDWQASIDRDKDFQEQQDKITDDRFLKQLEDRTNFYNKLNEVESKGLSGLLTSQFNFHKDYDKRDKKHNEDVIATQQAVQSSISSIIEIAGKKNTGIAKALAIAQATINTWAGASLALRTYAYNPPLAASMAGIIVAAGLLQVAQIAGVGFADGGMMTGGTPGRDSIPAAYMPGELVAPTRSFDEVVEGTAMRRGWQPPQLADSAPREIEVVLTLKDGLGDFIQREIDASNDLGTYRK